MAKLSAKSEVFLQQEDCLLDEELLNAIRLSEIFEYIKPQEEVIPLDAIQSKNIFMNAVGWRCIKTN